MPATMNKLAARASRRLRQPPKRSDFLSRLPKDAVCAEIGVFRGEFSRQILEIKAPRELHLIDGWWELNAGRSAFCCARTRDGR